MNAVVIVKAPDALLLELLSAKACHAVWFSALGAKSSMQPLRGLHCTFVC